MSYEINYEDQKFKDVEADKKQAISDLEKTYSGIIDKSDGFFQSQVDAAKDWEKKQTDIQNQQTEFAIQEIEQKKDQAQKDYTKEQSGAYADWQKQSNPYGARAEQIADMGMQTTGYSESSQVAMYNNYQNRVVAARESFTRIVQDFDNDITQARLQNNAALAEIAFNSLQKRLELNLQGFQYKNQLLLEQATRKTELEQIYHERWQDVLDQMNTENALAEDIRQFNEQMAEQQRQFNFHNKLGEFAEAVSSGGGGGGGGGGGSSSSSSSRKKTDNKISDDKKATNTSSTPSAADQLNAAIAAGASKDKVSNAISLAVSNGTVSKSEAAELRKTFTPRGYTY